MALWSFIWKTLQNYKTWSVQPRQSGLEKQHAEIHHVHNWAHLISFELRVQWMGIKGDSHLSKCLHLCEDQMASWHVKSAVHICGEVPLGLALSSEMALCLHAVQFIFFPRQDLTSHLFMEDTSGDNLQHFQWRIQPLQEVPCRTSACLLKSKCSERAGNGFSFSSHVYPLGHTRSTPMPPVASVGLVVVGVVCRVLFYFVTLFTFSDCSWDELLWSPHLISINFSYSLI